MTKLLLLLSLFILLVSCQGTDPCQQSGKQDQSTDSACTTAPDPAPAPTPTPAPAPNPTPTPVPAPKEIEDDVPNEALLFDATVQFTNFSRNDELKVYLAIDIIKKVVASAEFRTRVLNYTYQGKKTFVDNRGLTNAQIYQKLLEGKEDLRPVVDYEMDLDLQLYYSSFNTVGYTYPDGLRIWMNTKFFNSYTPSEVAGNIFHEWLHKLGFDHASSYSVARDSSVPYAIGYLIEELGKKYQ